MKLADIDKARDLVGMYRRWKGLAKSAQEQSIGLEIGRVFKSDELVESLHLAAEHYFEAKAEECLKDLRDLGVEV